MALASRGAATSSYDAGPTVPGNAPDLTNKEVIEANLADNNFWVRYQTSKALAAAPAATVLPHGQALARLAAGSPPEGDGRDESRLVRREATRALCALGPLLADNKVCHKALVTALGDEEQLVRRDVARALCDMGEGAKEHAALLAPRLRDSFWPVRFWAARSFGKFPQAAAAPHADALTDCCIEDLDSSVRESAALSLGTLGRAANAQVRKLCTIMMMRQGVHWYPQVGSEDKMSRSGEALASALGVGSSGQRKATASGLLELFRAAQLAASGSLDSTHEVAALEVAIVDTDWICRRKALDTLSEWAMKQLAVEHQNHQSKRHHGLSEKIIDAEER